MSWIKIDNSFPDHPKVVGLSDAAFRAHIQGLCYCGRFLTDGFIPSVYMSRIGTPKAIAELVKIGLWKSASDGFQIHDYLSHQTSKNEVEKKREQLRESQKRYRKKKSASAEEPEDQEFTEWEDQDNAVTNSVTNAVSNELVTLLEDRRQKIEKNTEEEIDSSSQNLPLPRVKSAKLSAEKINKKLSEARAQGINAWNISRLIEDEWDILHDSDDLGGCIALTAWYVSELQSRALTSQEIARIGQMTKRFGRIALLAIDEAASKDLDDLVSYAFRVAQNKYKERTGK